MDGQLLAEKTSGVSAAVALDRHGDAVMWYPTTGVPISAYKVYDPYGAITKTSGGAQSALGFQGQFTDASTGDVNMGARWYNSSGGSFRGRDTVFGSLGSPSTLNRFSYVSNNPLNSFDPIGREEFSVDLSMLGSFGGDAFSGLDVGSYSPPVIVSYETANPSAGVYNFVANVSDGSSTIATIAPTGVNVSLPTTTVSSGYLAYTPNDATAAAAIVLIESGTPSPAIGQAINDAYNAVSAAPTQEAILATAAANAAAALAAAEALAVQATAASAAAQLAAALAAMPPPTPTSSGPSEAPGDPDLRSAEQGTLSQPTSPASTGGVGAFESFGTGSMYSTSYEALPGTGSVVRVNKNGTSTACEPFSSPYSSSVRNCVTTNILLQTSSAVPAQSTEQATLAKWTEWDQANPTLSGSVNAGNPNAYNSNITGLSVASLDGKGPRTYTADAICKAAGYGSVIPPLFPTGAFRDWALWTASTPGMYVVGKAGSATLQSLGAASTGVAAVATPVDAFCRLLKIA